MLVTLFCVINMFIYICVVLVIQLILKLDKMEKRAISIRLSSDYAKVLQDVMEEINEDGIHILVDVVKESDNITKFVFDDPD